MPEAHSLPLVRLNHVSLCFGSNLIFSDLSFSLERGRHLALLGPNGAGKSSFLRLLQGELRPTATTTPYEDSGIFWGLSGTEERSALTAREHVRLVSHSQQTRYVRQGWKISGEEILLSGVDNAAMLYGEVSSRHYDRAAELAEAAHASHLMGMLAPAMSQGQLRLVLILRALMSAPSLLLLDEPFDGLDTAARTDVGNCIELAAQRGSTLVVSAHRKQDIPAFFSEALHLRCGALEPISLEEIPDRQSLSNTEKTPSAPLLASGFSGEWSSQTADNDFTRALQARKSPLLQLAGVDVFIDRTRVLFDISWTVNPGENWILSGSNGAGKSTLLRLLYGEEFAAYGGELSWCGGMHPTLEELHSGVGFVSDRLLDSYDYDLNSEDVVISGLRGSIGLYHSPSDEERSLARDWLERLGVLRYAAERFHTLSSGTARKVLLARALAGAPPVLLLDEPCSGLDRESRNLFLNTLPVLAERGVTIIFVSHHEQDKDSGIFTHEMRLDKGRVCFCGLITR